ncbi:hypothetical protein [Paraclostridium sordellii]|uniref:hypothetical protein n=1 Tax=Paraclostridium sordellii TaxID=1505 RepID=UPI000AD92D70
MKYSYILGGLFINFDNCKLVSLNNEILNHIFLWRYESPYNIYDLLINSIESSLYVYA